MVFNTIFRYFRYDITPHSAVNGCYRRNLSWLTGGVVLDEIVAFATDFGSSTHHTQSPKTRPKPRFNTIPNLHHPTSTNHNPTLSSPTASITILTQTHTTSYSRPHPNISSIIHLSLIHPYTDAYTFNCKQIINFIYFYWHIDFYVV